MSDSALGRSRPLVLGAVALGLALYAQKLIVGERAANAPAIRWYAAAVILLIVAWLGTYRNKSFLLLPPRPSAKGDRQNRRAVARTAGRQQSSSRLDRWPALAARRSGLALAARYLLAVVALGLNLYGLSQLRANDYTSMAGGLMWLASLLLLLIAFVGYRAQPLPSADAGAQDVEDKTDLQLPRPLEITIFVAIFILALALRLYRLDDWTTGVHGDEGEAGMDALAILEGNPVSPFRTGWFGQPNFYYWGIALAMKAFGTGLGGLRTFSTLAGVLMILPFYPLVRQWFGVRTAIIASVFLAISDVAIHFSRQEFSNLTMPLFLVVGFFFFFRGLRDRRPINFVLAGYSHILSMYFYQGGWLTPILLAAYITYLFVVQPLLRVPAAGREIRRQQPDLSRLGVLRQATRREAGIPLLYANQLVAFALACVCFLSPRAAFFIDHRAEQTPRVNEKIIFAQPQRMVQNYGATHEPFYVGVRLPTREDILPTPLVAEQTALSMRVAEDGFWPRVLWGQLNHTLSIITFAGDASGVYSFAEAPVAKPIEAALIVLGIGWALWRWRDTRMALLSLWFWATVLSGGVLTIDQPYMARLVAIIPTLAVFAALPLNRLVAEFVRLVAQVGRSAAPRRIAQALSGAGLLALLGFLALQNYADYYERFLAKGPFREASGQAAFVRWMNQRVTAEGRPLPRYYSLGAHFLYWGYGVNRFLNHGTPGGDLANPANDLPLLDNGDRDAVFMVWSPTRQYLQAIRAYYPDGIEQPFNYGPPGHESYLLTGYRVKNEQLDQRRVALATYTPASGPAVERQEAGLGSSGPPPGDLLYPLQARWTGDLIAPAFSRYQFHLDGPADASLRIDGTPVLTATAGARTADAVIALARGPHDVEVNGSFPSAEARVSVQWGSSDRGLAPVPAASLWSGPGRALVGEIRRLAGDPFGAWSTDLASGSSPIMRRVDGFLGFRDAPSALGGGPLMGSWSSTLNITGPGLYQFDLTSNGDSTLTVDGNVVVDNRRGGTSPHAASGRVNLSPGPHPLEVRYAWSEGVGILEALWTPPGGEPHMLGPAGLQADSSGAQLAAAQVNLPSAQAQGEPVVVSAQRDAERALAPPELVLEARSDLLAPRGMAVDSSGNLFIADSEHQRVVVLDQSGKLIRSWGREGKGEGEFGTPEDVALGPDGNVYVLDSKLPRVQVFNPNGKLERVIDGGGWCSPAGFTVAPDGDMYVADTCGGRIRKYSPTGDPKGEYGGDSPTGRLEQPVDVAVGEDGAIYVADLHNRIVKLDPVNGAVQKGWEVEVGTAVGGSNLAIAGPMLYLTDPSRRTLALIDTASDRVEYFGRDGREPGQFSQPVGVAVGSDGKVYVLDSDRARVQVFVNLAPQ